MFVRSYGLFWRRDEVNWNPGKGKRGAFRLLGRIGAQKHTLRLADFRFQQGIYILYGDYGPCYAGQTQEQGLGKRLDDHRKDKLAKLWDRFSWFGFCEVKKEKDKLGLCLLKAAPPEIATGSSVETITDAEALLIKAMGLRNVNTKNFHKAEKWAQVETHEAKKYMEKVRPQRRDSK